MGRHAIGLALGNLHDETAAVTIELHSEKVNSLGAQTPKVRE
jgi:hypothetical protein